MILAAISNHQSVALARWLDGDAPNVAHARDGSALYGYGEATSDGWEYPLPTVANTAQAAVADSVAHTRALMAGMSADERIELWARLRSGYCGDCGRELMENEFCHCENDE